MREISKAVKAVFAVCFSLCLALWPMMIAAAHSTDDVYFVLDGENFEVSQYVKMAEVRKSIESSTNENVTEKKELRLFGVFPIKTVNVTKTQRKYVTPGGIPFGIKLVSDGVLITAVGGVNCRGKIVAPARDAGIKCGDAIISVNGKRVYSNEDVFKEMKKEVSLEIRHQNGECQKYQLEAVLDPSDNSYKLGIWVRDSSAGIGTITFFDSQNGTFGGLGHPVCDSDTGNMLALLKGEVVAAEIGSVVKGKNGSPGRLCGQFLPFKESGKILENNETGVFGTLKNVKTTADPIPVAFKQEIKTGKATILTTISGTKAEEFKIEIEKICIGNRSTKNMVVHITDERLLSRTGGIVQGMSGCPIIQNGKLIGAVSHVFVNDSTRGYAIFAENMLETAKTVADNQLKDAS